MDSNYIQKYEGLPKDSINTLSREINARWQIEKDEREFERYSDIIDAMLSAHDVYIDSTQTELEKCFYLKHSNLKEEGIVCYFNTDSLSTGPHELMVKRKLNNKSGFRTLTLFLPFIIR